MRNVAKGFLQTSFIIMALALMVLLLAPLWAQPGGSRQKVTYVNATNATIGPSRFEGIICLTNATSNAHQVNVGNASSYRPGMSVKIFDTGGKVGNFTIVSVSNINGAANYSLNNDTYQGVELVAVANGSTNTTASAFVAHAIGPLLVAPSP